MLPWAIEAKKIYIYMRDEYPGIIKKMKKELIKLEESNIIDKETKSSLEGVRELIFVAKNQQ